MSTLFTHVPHPRISERKQEKPVRVQEQRKGFQPGASIVERFNSRVGLVITVVVGTMWAAYLFAAIALISLPDNVHKTQDLILWISSSFLQLVLLPIIIVGQNIQAKAADKRAEATYKDADAVLHEAMQIQEHLEAQDKAIADILDHLRQAGKAAAVG
jgi:hypothetical protein